MQKEGAGWADKVIERQIDKYEESRETSQN